MATARKTAARGAKIVAPVYQLRIELLDVMPLVWRRLLVPGSMKLHQLHVALLWTMGWAGGHLHEFIVGHHHYGEPDPDFDMGPPLQRENRFTLASALGSHNAFVYLYDYGDGWEHRVTVEQLLPFDPALRLPHCIDGANACPPEDVGGPPGYADFLQAIGNPKHKEHRAMLEWCGGQFDPAAFDSERVNEALHEFKL